MRSNELPLKFPLITRGCSLAILLVCSVSFFVSGQESREVLEQKQEQLLKQIAQTSKLLEQNSNEQKTSLESIEAMDAKIKAQSKLLKNYEHQVKATGKAITSLEGEVSAIEENLSTMEDSYGKLLVGAYRQKLSQNRWLFLLSANGLNELWRRWTYIGRLRKAWDRRADVLFAQKDLLITKQEKLDQERRSTLALKKKAGILLNTQQSDKGKLERVLSGWKVDEKKLKKELAAQEKKRSQLLAAIEKIIAAELAAKPENLPNTPLGRISASFAKSLGNLPWPVDKGVIFKQFGTRRHPALPNVTISNNGIDIQSIPNAPVRVIFDGTVVSNQQIPGFDYVVIVNHGNFYSVYSYLAKSSVTKGTKVSLGQRIGYARDRQGGSEVHFEIWKGKSIQDPLLWLKRQ